MGGDEVWWTLYVRKVYVGKWRTAAEAKANYELPQPAPVETR